MNNIAVFSGLLLAGFLACLPGKSFSQTATAAPTREERFKKLESKMVFPLIKGGAMVGVIPVENINFKPLPEQETKLVFDFTQSTSKDNQAKKINEGLEEVARILNLHIAAGIKKEKLKATIVFHSGSILSVLTNDYYQQTFQNDNPNSGILNQLTNAGVEMVICGQSLALREISSNKVIPNIKISLSAKTSLSKLHTEGYYTFDVKAE